MLISDKKVVLIDYTLRTDNGDVVDSSEDKSRSRIYTGGGQIRPWSRRARSPASRGCREGRDRPSRRRLR